jgi:hypothetical protein
MLSLYSLRCACSEVRPSVDLPQSSSTLYVVIDNQLAIELSPFSAHLFLAYFHRTVLHAALYCDDLQWVADL